MNTANDYSDQAIASYVYWMWRRTKDWGRVWFQTQKRFRGEGAARLQNVFERTRAAVANMPPPIRWKCECTPAELRAGYEARIADLREALRRQQEGGRVTFGQ
jgi:hypothetical protein